MTGVVYVATNNTDGKQYVGLTRKGVAARWAQHKQHSRSPRTYFHKAIAKHGAGAFTVTAYASSLQDGFLAELEKEVIMQLAPAYNQTCGGEVTFGRKYDDATKERIRTSNTGKKRTDEQRLRNSEQKREWFAQHPEEKQRVAQRLSEARGRINHVKRKAAAADATRNRAWTEASRAKLSASCVGRRYGPEIISKMAETKKRKIYCATAGVTYNCREDAARACGVSPQSVFRVCNGKYPSVKGFAFSYA